MVRRGGGRGAEPGTRCELSTRLLIARPVSFGTMIGEEIEEGTAKVKKDQRKVDSLEV